MYTDTVTLFNRCKDWWYPTILRGVNLNMDKSSIIARYGAESQDKAILNVRYRDCAGAKMIGDKIWMPPKEWRQQDDSKRSEFITFTDGERADFFCVGEWGSEEPIADDDFVEGFYNYMNTTRDYVFTITTVSGPYHTIPHFEITGA